MSAWTRVGRGSIARMTLVLLAIVGTTALLLAGPLSDFAALTFGAEVPWVAGWIAGILVLFLISAPVLLPRATRPVYIDSARALLRVAGRRIPVTELRLVYRIPDPQFDGRFQLRLVIPGLDPLIGISSALPAELSAPELDALLAAIERAPIEPDPAVPLRPPLDGELGTRSEAEVFDDRLVEQLLPFQRTSYAKPTLLLELRRAREAIAGHRPGLAVATVRDIGLVSPGVTHAPHRTAALNRAGRWAGPRRGFFAMFGPRFREALAATEAWLVAVQPGTFAPSHGWRWWAGLAAMGCALASIVVGGYLDARSASPGSGPAILVLLAAPGILWPGAVGVWAARVARFDRARRAAIAAKRSGSFIPEFVTSFFGPQLPETALARHLIWLLTVEFILLAGAGAVLISLSGERAGGALLPTGIALLIASLPLFAGAVRVAGRVPVRQLRGIKLWRALDA